MQWTQQNPTKIGNQLTWCHSGLWRYNTVQCNTVQYDCSNQFSTSPRFQNGYEVNSTLYTLHWPNQTSEMDEWVGVGVLVLYWGTDIRRWNAVQYSEVSTVQYNTVNTMHITHAINTTKSDGNQQSNYLMSLWSLKKECSTIQCNTVQYDYSNKFSTSPRFQNGYEVNSRWTIHRVIAVWSFYFMFFQVSLTFS